MVPRVPVGVRRSCGGGGEAGSGAAHSPVSRSGGGTDATAEVGLVTAACEDPEDGGLDRGPIVEDHRRVESQGHEAEGRRDRITDEVAVPALAFMRSTVGLDDEAVPYDQVDSADAGNGDLGEAGDAEEVQPISDERFEPAVRIRSREIDQWTDADGYRGSQLFPFAVREEPLPQRGFERAEKGLRAGASGNLAQAVHEVDRLEATRCPVTVSVDDDADGRAARSAASVTPASRRVRVLATPPWDTTAVTAVGSTRSSVAASGLDPGRSRRTCGHRQRADLVGGGDDTRRPDADDRSSGDTPQTTVAPAACRRGERCSGSAAAGGGGDDHAVGEHA